MIRYHHRSLFVATLGVAVGATSCTQRAAAPPASGIVTRTDSMSSAGGGYTTTMTGVPSDSIVYLATGDSIEWQSAGPARVTGQPEGLLVSYHPFFDLADTARVRRTALCFFDSLRTKFTNGEPPFVVLRAVNLRAADRNGSQLLHAYGIVLEKRADGRWYGLNESSPLDLQGKISAPPANDR